MSIFLGRSQFLGLFILPVLGSGMDYRCEDSRKKVGKLRGDFGVIKKVLNPSFIHRDHHLKKKKNELFNQEMLMKISPLSRDLKLTSFKSGCRVSALTSL
jgi:hypothetical protein